MDLNVDKKPDLEEKKNSSHSPKTCSGCQTTRTPLWRGGPAGPKVHFHQPIFRYNISIIFVEFLGVGFQSLCNACGIKYNKKRRQLLGLETGRNSRKKKRSSVSNRSNEVREILKMRFMSFRSDVLLQRSRKLMSKLREEEQAAILLMALSCGSVYA